MDKPQKLAELIIIEHFSRNKSTLVDFLVWDFLIFN